MADDNLEAAGAATPAPKRPSSRPDLASLGGVVIALGALLGGMVLEGGKVVELLQLTAALVVFGGTLGAVMVTTPLTALLGAVKGLKSVFFEKTSDPEAAIEEIIAYASKARKNSIISLEEDLDNVADPFLKKALTLAVDGTDLQELRRMMELELFQTEKHAESEAKVFEAAGGYSPTIGIIGAVMGLMQVMKHLENIDEVGVGIANAFVATVYGVAAANLFFLPAANKLKARIENEVRVKELLLEGVAGILEGMNPKLIRVKLEAFLVKGGKDKTPAPAVAKEPAAVEG